MRALVVRSSKLQRFNNASSTPPRGGHDLGTYPIAGEEFDVVTVLVGHGHHRRTPWALLGVDLKEVERPEQMLWAPTPRS